MAQKGSLEWLNGILAQPGFDPYSQDGQDLLNNLPRDSEAFKQIMLMQARQTAATPGSAAGWQNQTVAGPQDSLAQQVANGRWGDLNAQSQKFEDSEQGSEAGMQMRFLMGVLGGAAGGYFGGAGGVTDLGGGLTVDGWGNVVGGSGINTGGSILPGSFGGDQYANLGSLTDSAVGDIPWNDPSNYGYENAFDTGAQQAIGGTPAGPGPWANTAPYQGPGPWLNTEAYPNYTQKILDGTMDYGKLGAELGASGFDTAGLTSAASTVAGKTALQRLFSGDATAADYGELGLRALPGVLGAFGASRQASQLGSLADRFQAAGAPSRARYEASFAPGFTMANDPGYQDALDQSSKATLHSLSVNGNPAGSPNAWAASLADNNAKFAYPALQSYRTSALNASGIPTFNAAAPGAMTGAIGQGGQALANLGGAFSDVVNPKQSLNLADLLKQFGAGGGGNDIFKVA